MINLFYLQTGGNLTTRVCIHDQELSPDQKQILCNAFFIQIGFVTDFISS